MKSTEKSPTPKGPARLWAIGRSPRPSNISTNTKLNYQIIDFDVKILF
jgi:hypothetical protein